MRNSTSSEADNVGEVLLAREGTTDDVEPALEDWKSPVPTRRAKSWGKLSSLSTGFWALFTVWSLLTARRLLTNDFPYPLCFLVLLQGAAFCAVVAIVVLVVLFDLVRRKPRSPAQDPNLSVMKLVFIVLRYSLTSCISAAAVICTMEAVMRYTNFSVLVMLPILTYAIDGILFVLAHTCRLVNADHSLDWRFLSWSVMVCILMAGLIFQDYRIDLHALSLAILGSALLSISRLLASIGPQIPRAGNQTWTSSLIWSLWAGIPPCFFFTISQAFVHEDVNKAYQLVSSWGSSTILATLAPGVLTQILWNRPLRATFPLSATEGNPYENRGENITDVIEATLLASILSLVFSGSVESNMVDWIQVLLFVVIIVASIGPKQIATYPPRVISFLRRGSRDSKWHALWQRPGLLITSTTCFTVLTSICLLYLTDTLAFDRSIASWPAGVVTLDQQYRAPSTARVQVVIAHAEGEPIDTVSEIVSYMRSSELVQHVRPHVIIYTKDPSETAKDRIINATGGEDIDVKSLRNIGGTTATYLQHILEKWDELPTQTFFMSSNDYTAQNWGNIKTHLDHYYNAPASYPYPETMFPLTTFLHLGAFSTCNCNHCHEPGGWNDTFRMIPSMWAASHPDVACKKVLLTHGNNFVASASRLRGVKKDVWDTLYYALVNDDIGNAWAHDKAKIGLREGLTIEGHKDSLETPFLGYTVERLWAVLLQCSNKDIAWRCPNLSAGPRIGGDASDCACID